MNEYQPIINLASGAFIAGIGWFCKAIWDAVNRLQQEIHDIECSLPILYVRKDEFNDAVKTIFDKLDKIYDKLESKLDSKADK